MIFILIIIIKLYLLNILQLFLFINIASCLSHFILILHIAYNHFHIQKGALKGGLLYIYYYMLLRDGFHNSVFKLSIKICS